MYQGQIGQLQANIKKCMFANFPTMHFANPMSHFIFDEDFNNFTGSVAALVMPGWTAVQVATGAVTIPDGESGTLQITAAAAGADGDGINLQKISASFLPAATKDIWFETRLNISHQGCQFFAGLAIIDATIITGGAAGAMACADWIGWSSVTDDSVILFGTESTAGGASATAAALTHTPGTNFKLAFHVEGTTIGTLAVHQYVNDVYVSTIHHTATAYLPVVVLTPSFVCQSDGGDTAIVTVDYVRVVQLR